MIEKLSRLDLFDPDDPASLADCYMLIDPGDIDRPPALNLFDPGTDLALFGNGQKIAIEISVTNRPDYELENIKKGLEAGFDHIWMLSDDQVHLEAITSLTLSSLSPTELARVSFGSTTNAETWIIQFPTPTTGQGELAGYIVETVLVAANSIEDCEYRKAQIQHI